MEQTELLTQTYEAVTNPILRLLIYFLAAAVTALTGAVVYLFRKYVALSEESIRALADTANALEQFNHNMSPNS